MHRFSVLLVLSGGLACAAADTRPVHALGAVELQTAIRAENVTVAGAVASLVERISVMDAEFSAMIAITPGLEAQASALDRDAGTGGLLHGLPVLLKDNIETRELPTTAGSLALADNRTERDAPLVTNLRDAGAVILGKTNLSEWANFRSSRSSSGWSAVGGQTRNAVDPTRTPCGSSSGSAVAVALGYAPLAIGTETNGSIVCPASVNGVVGFKPTVGLVSAQGIVPISVSQDTAGPLARSVEDAALLFGAMMVDDAPVAMPESLAAADLEGLRIGVVRSATGYHEGVDALFDATVASLAAAGATVVDDLTMERPEGFGRQSYQLLLAEFRTGIDAYLATLPGARSAWTLETLIAFNDSNATREHRWFGQEIFLAARDVPGATGDAYVSTRDQVQAAARSRIDDLLKESRLDVLIAPTTGPAWKIDLVNGDNFGGGFSSFPAVSGYPHLTLPMGRVHGLPVGLSVTAGRHSDGTVLAAGLAFERLALAAQRWDGP